MNTQAVSTATNSHKVASEMSKSNAGSSLRAVFAMVGVPMLFESDTEIFGEAEPAEYFYEVISGAVRTYKLLDDGRRQIGSFYLPGDVFGLEAGGAYALSAEAISRCNIRLAKRSVVLGMVARDPELGQALWAAAARELIAAQEHLLVLGRRTAEERVASFLLDIAHREANSDVIELPMCRQDIADYLGLTIETISRTISLLESENAIALPTPRRVIVKSGDRLRQLNA